MWPRAMHVEATSQMMTSLRGHWTEQLGDGVRSNDTLQPHSLSQKKARRDGLGPGKAGEVITEALGINAQAGVAGHAGDSTAPRRKQCPRSVARTLACTLSTGWAKTWRGESPTLFSLPLRHHFCPQARPTPIGKRMAVHMCDPGGAQGAGMSGEEAKAASSRSLPTPKT